MDTPMKWHPLTLLHLMLFYQWMDQANAGAVLVDDADGMAESQCALQCAIRQCMQMAYDPRAGTCYVSESVEPVLESR